MLSEVTREVWLAEKAREQQRPYHSPDLVDRWRGLLVLPETSKGRTKKHGRKP
jgi:hypothetical protein